MDQFYLQGLQQKDKIKTNTFRRKNKDKKKFVKNFGWAVQKWSRRHLLSFFWQCFDKNA